MSKLNEVVERAKIKMQVATIKAALKKELKKEPVSMIMVFDKEKIGVDNFILKIEFIGSKDLIKRKSINDGMFAAYSESLKEKTEKLKSGKYEICFINKTTKFTYIDLNGNQITE